MTWTRLRKFIGMVMLVGFVCLYALAAMVMAAALLPGWGHGWQMVYYAVAGLAWVIPAGLIIYWMERPRRG